LLQLSFGHISEQLPPRIKACLALYGSPLNWMSLPWWTIRSITAAAIWSSPNTEPHRQAPTFPCRDIARLTDTEVPPNRRNGLKQNQYLYLARRSKQDMKDIGLPMKRNEGRPKESGTKRDIIRDYAVEHP